MGILNYKFDFVLIIFDVKYKNEVNFDIKIRFKVIDGLF